MTTAITSAGTITAIDIINFFLEGGGEDGVYLSPKTLKKYNVNGNYKYVPAKRQQVIHFFFHLIIM